MKILTNKMGLFSAYTATLNAVFPDVLATIKAFKRQLGNGGERASTPTIVENESSGKTNS